MTDTRHPFIATLEDRFGGLLMSGDHAPDGQACALEAVSQARGLEWTDDPTATEMPDLRSLNDALWPSDKARAEALTPVVLALWDWADWPEERRWAWARTLALRTIREVVPIALDAVGLPDHARACREAPDLTAAAEAAETAAWAAATAAVRAASAVAAAAVAAETARAEWAAATAAARAAWAAATASEAETARADVLTLACRIWVESVPVEVTP